MSDRKVKIGIIGAGIWGSNHALALSTHPQGELALICDRDPERAKALAERFDCAWTDSLDNLASSDVEAVTIATPDPFHRDPTVAMLSAGKHVLCEKPLATTVADGIEMVRAADAAGTKFMIDFHARWHPLFMGAKGYAERGELGDPVMAYARLSDTIHVPTKMLKWGGQSGPEWFLYPHIMDAVRWMFAREPVSVYAQGHRGVLDGMGINSWDAIQSLISFEGSAFCTFETSWILPESYSNVVDNRIFLNGTMGGLEVRNEPSLWAYTDRFHTPFASESITRYGKVSGFQYDSIRYFIDCVADDIVPECTGRDGLVVTAMIEATMLSLAEKRPVSMSEVLDLKAV